MRIVLEIDRSNLPKEATGDILDRAYTVIENRINGLGVAEPSLRSRGKTGSSLNCRVSATKAPHPG